MDAPVLDMAKKGKYRKAKRRSGFEDSIEKSLKDKKVKYTYEPFKLEYIVPEMPHIYTPDFELTSSGIVVEAKGKWTAADRKKMLMVIDQHSDLDIRMVFQRDNYLHKGSKTKYSAWCDKKGIVYSVGGIPDEWL